MPTVTRGDAALYYEVTGSGPAVVFAHGAGGNRISWWQQVPYFAAHRTVIAFDHRRFGRSTCPRESFHPNHFPGDLLAILDAEEIDRAALVCQSMGGWTGVPTALHHPERVACLVLCGTPGGIVTESVLQAATRIATRASDEGITGNAALAPDFPEREPAKALLYDQLAGLNINVDPSLLGALFDEKARVAPEALAEFEVPTLLLAGEYDALFPPDVIHDVAGRIPGARVVDFPGSGHSTYFEQPARFNEIVETFLDEHGAQRRRA